MRELELVENEEGAWELYDDSYDITIHCETEDEMNRVIDILKGKSWISADQHPKPEEYVLLSFENFSIPLVGMYRNDDDGGAYYIGDDEESCISHDIIVNAWMPLPKPYRSEKESE
mgnify:CR=1 FL=1